MAAIPTSYTRFKSSAPGTRVPSGLLVTSVTPRRPLSLATTSQPGKLFALPKEPEDAKLTGGTRSLDRRLLALNIAGTLPKPTLAKGPMRALPLPGARPSAA
jgi:hypothetical protein